MDMNAVQSFVFLVLLIPVTYVVVKGYYAEQKRMKDAANRNAIKLIASKFEEIPNEEAITMAEVASTRSESVSMETPEDFLELVLNPLTISNLYDTALANYIRLSKQAKEYIFMADELADETLQDATILQVLEDEHLVFIYEKDNRPHYTVSYAIKLYLRMNGIEADAETVKNLKSAASKRLGIVLTTDEKEVVGVGNRN